MKHRQSVFISIIMLGFIHAQAIGQTNGITLQLTVPNSPLLCAEENSIQLCVKNESGHPLPIVASLQEAVRTQIKIELGYTSQRYRTLRYSQSASWDAIVNKADKILTSGQSHVWDWIDHRNLIAYTELLYSISSLMVTNIIVSLQVGSNQWVSTPPIPITVLTEKESREIENTAVPVFEVDNRNQSTGQSWKEPLNKITIKGREYLFTASGVRLCEISPDDMPSIRNKHDGSGFELNFNKSGHLIRYNFQTMKIEKEQKNGKEKGQEIE